MIPFLIGALWAASGALVFLFCGFRLGLKHARRGQKANDSRDP